MPLDPDILAARARDALALKGPDPGPLIARRCPDGAVRETWAVTGAGVDLILRTDGPSDLSESQSRVWEYARLKRAYERAPAAPVPQPVLLAPGEPPFFLMERRPGTAWPSAVLAEAGDAFARDCAAALAAIHAVPTMERVDAPARALACLHARLNATASPRPCLAWALAWCATNRPEAGETVFAHRDYRVGNLLCRNGRLSGVLDWEFAGPSDPYEDLGWLSAPAWRHGRGHEAGGVAPWAVFAEGYEAASGRRIESGRLLWWRVVAQLRWAFLALEQAARGMQPGASLDLALTGHRLPSVERDALLLLGQADAGDGSVLTPDTPDADTLRALAAGAAPCEREAAYAETALALADRLSAAPPRDVARAAALQDKIVRDGPRPDLLPILMADAFTRSRLSAR